MSKDRLTAAKNEVVGVRRMLFPHADNSLKRIGFVWMLLAVWGSITVGIAYGAAEATPVYSMLTALVWALVGRMWGGEVKDITSG